MNQKPTASKLALIGMTGSGKSTVGKKLAELTGYAYLDLDDVITEREGKTPRELFDSYGEEYFRSRERVYLEEAIEKERTILACGGGVILSEENRKLLRKTETVWILRPFRDVLENEAVLKRPPINGDPENYRMLYAKRRRLYGSCAKMAVMNTDSDKCARDILSAYHLKGCKKT